MSPPPDASIEELLAERAGGAPVATLVDESVQALRRETRLGLRSSLAVGLGQNPDQAAQALDLSRRTGLPADLDPAAAETASRDQRLADVPLEQIELSGALSSFLSEPTRAAAAGDDLENLTALSEALAPPTVPLAPPRGSLGDVLSARTSRGRAMIERSDAAYRAIFDTSPEALSDLARLDAELRSVEVPEGSGVAEFLGSAAEMLPLLGEQLGAAAVGATLGAGSAVGLTLAVGQIPPFTALPEEIITLPAAAVSGAVIGGKTAAAYRIFKLEAGNAFADFRELRDEDGAPLPDIAVKGAALVVGGLNAGLEFLSLRFLLRAIPGGQRVLSAGSKSAARAAMRQALRKDPTMRQAMTRIGTNYIAAVTAETTTEVAQATIENTAENILATTLGTGEHILPSGRQIEEIALEGVEAFRATVVLGGAGSTVRVGTETARRIQHSRQLSARLEAADKAAEKSKLRERSPEFFSELTSKMAAENGFFELHIPAQHLIDVSEASGFDLATLPEEVVSQLGEAQLTGGDVLVPVGDYFTLLPEDVRAALAPEVRDQAEALSLREAEEAEQTLTQGLEALAEEVDAEASSTTPDAAPEAAASGLFGTAEDAGMTEKEFAAFQAARDEAVAAEQAELKGEDPQLTGRSVPGMRLEFLFTEETALAQKVGRRNMPRRVAKAAAQRIIASKLIHEIRPERYRATAARQAVLAVKAARDGDIDASLDAKRRQILNSFLEAEARRVRDRVSANLKALGKFRRTPVRERIGKAGADYLEQIDGLLSRFELRRSLPQTERKQGLAEWIREREAEGEEVIIPKALREEARDIALRTHWRNLTPTQLQDLRNSIDNIAHLAKLKTELQVAGQKRELEEVTAELAAEAHAGILRPAKRSAKATADRLDRWRARVRRIDASLTQTEWLVDTLGGADPESMWRQAILNPLLDAQDAFNTQWAKYGERLSEIMDAYDVKTLRQYRKLLDETRLLDTDGRPLELSRWNLIMVALNMGNASNLDKMLRGYGWDEATVMEVLDQHLSRADWDFVQSIWDTIGELWPQVADLERQMTGVVPPKIQPESVSTRFGSVRGGYFPVVYDPERSTLGARNEQFGLWAGQPNGYSRATTGHGHTQARTNVARPILLETSVISKHLHDVILDLTHREPLARVARVLATHQVDEALKATVGAEFGFSPFWLPWLKAIAGDVSNPGPIDIWNGAIRSVRLNVTTFKLGFRASTLFLQTSGHFNGFRLLREQTGLSNRDVARVWARSLYRSLDRFGLTNETARGVLESSTFMQNRVRTLDRDIRDIMRDAAEDTDAGLKVKQFAMSLIGHMQLRAVDIPLWVAARQIAVERRGLGEIESRRFADSIVRMSQGSGEILSQSPVLRGGASGNEFFKALTPFYSYNSTVYNQLRRAKRIATVASLPSFLAAYFFYSIGPAMYADLLRNLMRTLEGRQPSDDSKERELGRFAAKLAEILVGDTVATLPVVRGIWGSLIAFFDPSQRFRARPQGAIPIAQQELDRLGAAIRSGEGDRMMIAFARDVALAKGWPLDWPLGILERKARDR